MQYTVNRVKMQAIDRICMEKLGIPELVLMERAALEVTKWLFQMHLSKQCLIVAGTGNNGADGLAVARQLIEQGETPSIYIVGNFDKATEQFQVQYKILRNLKAHFVDDIEEIKQGQYMAIVDAIFGVGLNRAIKGRYRELIEWINDKGVPIVSVDIPSGIDATTGCVLGCAIRATDTVTFGFMKNGLLLATSSEYVGTVHLVSAGFPRTLVTAENADGFYYEKDDLCRLLPKRNAWSNKGTYGKVLVIAGGRSMAGASYLCSKAAYRTGCGMVKVCTGIENRDILLSRLPELLLDPYRTIEEAYSKIKDGIAWADAVVFGCGMGDTEETEQLLRFVLENITIPLVLDADGLNCLSRQMSLLEKVRVPIILTPHLKEFSRLTGKTVEEIQTNLMESVKNFVKWENVVCVAKDSKTVVANKGNVAYINRSGNHGMATAGSGDVLSGILGSLLAQKKSAFETATLGVWIHGLAGDDATKEKGAYSVMAEDIVEHLQTVLGGKSYESLCRN